MGQKNTTANSTFAKWRVEEVLVRSVFNLTFVASRQVEVKTLFLILACRNFGGTYNFANLRTVSVHWKTEATQRTIKNDK